MSEHRPWGIRWHSDIKHINGSSCPKCGLQEDLSSLDYRKIRGFDTEGPAGAFGRKIFIFECPVCFEKYWSHCVEPMIRFAKIQCPHWPKDDEATG